MSKRGTMINVFVFLCKIRFYFVHMG